MKKIFLTFCFALILISASVLFVGCEDPILSIAIKSGPNIGKYYCEYYVGEDFNTENLTLVVKTKKTSYEVSLGSSEVLISNFSTTEATEKSVATVSYKGVQTTFDYAVLKQPITGFYGFVESVDTTYSGELVNFNAQKQLASADGVSINIKFANDTPFGTPGADFGDGVKDAGEYKLVVTYSKDNYQTKTSNLTLTIKPKKVNVELTYAPGSLSLNERLDSSLVWKRADSEVWNNKLDYFSGYQLFARVDYDDVAECDKGTTALTSIGFGLISNYSNMGINSEGYFGDFATNRTTNFKIKINSANSNYDVKQTMVSLEFQKADSLVAYASKSFEQAIKDEIDFNSLTLSKNGEDYILSIPNEISLACPVSGEILTLNPQITFTENNDNSVTATIVIESNCYTTVTLTKTFLANEIS